MRRVRLLFACVGVALLLPATAYAGPSEDYLAVYKAYQKTGTVDGCAFTAKKLASARKGVPPDIDTYAPDFPDALDAALSQRAGGGCGKGAKSGAKASSSSASPSAVGGAPSSSSGGGAGGGGAASAAAPGAPASAGGAAATPAPATPPGLTPAPAAEAAAAPAVADGSVATAAARRGDTTEPGGAPLPLVLLVALAILGASGALVWLAVRFFGFDPPWLISGRHATAEAGWRASASWAEFGDWLRFGR